MKYKKLFILCKGDSVTGGSELVHQLCHELTKLNLESYVSYYPSDTQYTIPDEYSIYSVKTAHATDDSNHLIILPEVATKYALHFKKSKIGIWWLSVDNYYRKKGDNVIKDKVKYIKDLIRLRLTPIFLMKNYYHFVQSEYAYRHLKDNNLDSLFLSDYLNPAHFVNSETIKENIILYNPVKGIKITQKLINDNKDFKFVPLENLTIKEVQKLFQKAKLYIDFGNHPGKDRMPREAAMANCCVITGRKGSAGNENDIPIPNKYKFNDKSLVDNASFRSLVGAIFDNHTHHLNDFVVYKNSIMSEHENFQRQVKQIFTKLLYEK